MADITMCKGTDCPYKENCKRYTALPSSFQSHLVNIPLKDGKCDFYWGKDAEEVWNEVCQIFKSNK